MSESWLAYLDESGAIDGRDGGLVLAIMLRFDEAHELDVVLHREIGGIYPGVPWPPHATDLNLPAAHALFAAAWSGPLPGPFGAADEVALARAVGYLRTLRSPRVQGALGRIRLGDRIPRETFEEVDRELRVGAPLAHAAAAGAARARWSRFRQLLVHLAETLDAPREGELLGEARAERGVFAVAAHVLDGVLPPRRDRAASAEAHLELLEVVAERIVACLPAPGGTARIRLWPAERGGFGRDLLRPAIERAQEFPLRFADVQAPEKLVRFDLMEPVPWNAQVPAGVVIADHLSNRLWQLVRHNPVRTLASLEVEAKASLGLEIRLSPLWSPGRPLPVIAAPRTPRDAIRAAFGGQSGAMPRSQRPHWAREQAEEWVALALESA